MPEDLSIAAMKAFALGRQAKWKDYVDLFFTFKHHSIQEVMDQAHEYYGEGEFNDKLFRGQLDFHQDINYIEPVDWMLRASKYLKRRFSLPFPKSACLHSHPRFRLNPAIPP